jgi:hypothetical protein
MNDNEWREPVPQTPMDADGFRPEGTSVNGRGQTPAKRIALVHRTLHR